MLNISVISLLQYFTTASTISKRKENKKKKF